MAATMSDGPEGARFRALTGRVVEPVTTNAEGWAEFRCPGGSVSVWVQET
jgi:alpha-amylase